MADTTAIHNETQLLLDLAHDSEQAFADLYRRYWQKIFQVALLYLKDQNHAEDIVQEVFMIIWKKRAELQHVQHFEKYIFTIARNLVISSLRKKMPVLEPVFEYTFSQQDSSHPSFALEYKEAAELLTQAVNELSPRQRELYLIDTEQQLSIKDAALQLNISYDAARQYKSEALRSIRRFLKGKLFSKMLLLVCSILF